MMLLNTWNIRSSPFVHWRSNGRWLLSQCMCAAFTENFFLARLLPDQNTRQIISLQHKRNFEVQRKTYLGKNGLKSYLWDRPQKPCYCHYYWVGEWQKFIQEAFQFKVLVLLFWYLECGLKEHLTMRKDSMPPWQKSSRGIWSLKRSQQIVADERMQFHCVV